MFKMVANKNATLMLVAILAVFAIALPQTEAGRASQHPGTFSSLRNKISRVIAPRMIDPVYMGRPMSSAASVAASSSGGSALSMASSSSGGSSPRYMPASYPSSPDHYGGVRGGYMPHSVPRYTPNYSQTMPVYTRSAPVVVPVAEPEILPRAYSHDDYAATDSYGHPDLSTSSYRKAKEDHILQVSGSAAGNKYQKTGAYAKSLDQHKKEKFHENNENVLSTPNLYQSSKSNVSWSKKSSKNSANSGSHSLNKDKFNSGFVHDERDLHERIKKRKNKAGVVASTEVERDINHHNEGQYDSAGLYPPAPEYVPKVMPAQHYAAPSVPVQQYAPSSVPVQQYALPSVPVQQYAPVANYPKGIPPGEYYEGDEDDEVAGSSASAAAVSSGDHSAASAAAASS